MTDPRDFRRIDPDRPNFGRSPPDPSANALWGWVAGAILVLAILVLAFGKGSNNTPTTAANAPTATVGSTPPAADQDRGAMPARPAGGQPR